MCLDRAGRYFGHDFPTCPVKDLQEDKKLQVVVALEGDAQIAPLANWPRGYAAWVVHLMKRLKSLRDKRQKAQISEIRNGTS